MANPRHDAAPAAGHGRGSTPGAPLRAGSISAGGWAWLMLGLTVAATAAIAAFNLVVDPSAQLGTGLLDPIAAGPRDRVAKATLLDRAIRTGRVDAVVLGSSRTKKVDPARLGVRDGFNAAVVGGDLFEARVFAAWLADRTREAGIPYPRLVVGVDVEQLRDSSLQGSGFLDVPRLAATARREAAGSDGSLADELDRLERLLLTWQVTKASAASVRARLRGTGPPAADAGGEPAAIDDFTAAGVPRDDAAWADPAVARRRSARTPAAIERNVEELRATYERNGATLDPDAVADLRALVRIAHEAGGPPPVLYVTPGHPALDALDRLGRTDRHAAVLALLRSVARDDRAIVVDCAACVDSLPTSWLDATHPSPLGTRQLALRLAPAIRSGGDS